MYWLSYKNKLLVIIIITKSIDILMQIPINYKIKKIKQISIKSKENNNYINSKTKYYAKTKIKNLFIYIFKNVGFITAFLK